MYLPTNPQPQRRNLLGTSLRKRTKIMNYKLMTHSVAMNWFTAHQRIVISDQQRSVEAAGCTAEDSRWRLYMCIGL